MKNVKALALLFLALLVGAAAAVYAANWASQQGNTRSSMVAVAAADIELGSKITPQMLTLIDWPSGAIPPGAFTQTNLLVDRVVKVTVTRGDPIVERKLAPAGTQGGLSAVIAEGKRAMTVRVNDVVGVAGFALPGNYVDVMVNAQQERGKGDDNRQISKTVLEHVLVLAVAQESGRDETKPKVVSAVTLELTLEDAEKLDLARSVGTLSLVLRNQVDKKTVATTGITKSQLFGEKEPAPPVKVMVAEAPRPPAPRPARISAPAPTPLAAPAQHCVEVIQNGLRALSCF